MMIRYTAAALAAALMVFTVPVSAELLKLDVTVTSATGAGFSAPIFTFTNLSTDGREISNVSVTGSMPWDWVIKGASGSPYEILNPAGGIRTLITGEENTVDPNNGCTTTIAYGLTSFDPGDTFRFAADPETPPCISTVVDVRPALTAGTIGISVKFDDGTTLSGTTWTKEDPAGLPSDYINQLYRLTLSKEIAGAVPEPASWALMIGGLALAGAALRRRQTPVLA